VRDRLILHVLISKDSKTQLHAVRHFVMVHRIIIGLYCKSLQSILQNATLT